MKFICTKHPELEVFPSIKFRKGRYETTDKNEIEILKTISDVEEVKEEKKK